MHQPKCKGFMSVNLCSFAHVCEIDICVCDCMCDRISVYACFEHNVSINISPSRLKNSSKKVGLCKIGFRRFATPKRVNKKRKYLAKKKKKVEKKKSLLVSPVT